jgi:Holliday junction resolvase RusA-like endonuclease
VTLLLAFTVPGSPVPSERMATGASGHRYMPPRSRAYRALVQQHLAAADPAQLGAVKCSERVRFVIRAFWGDLIARDFDNIEKAIVDAIKTSGLLADDNFKVVAGSSTTCDLDLENPRAEIEIHRAPPLETVKRTEPLHYQITRWSMLPKSARELARRPCPGCAATGVTGYSDGKSGSAIMCERCRGRGHVFQRQRYRLAMWQLHRDA